MEPVFKEIDSLSKRQKTFSQNTLSSIDRLLHSISECKTQCINAVGGQDESTEPTTMQSAWHKLAVQAKEESEKYRFSSLDIVTYRRINTEQKDLTSAVSKLGKAIDKVGCVLPCELPLLSRCSRVVYQRL
jgi:hypothetical protein